MSGFEDLRDEIEKNYPSLYKDCQCYTIFDALSHICKWFGFTTPNKYALVDYESGIILRQIHALENHPHD